MSQLPLFTPNTGWNAPEGLPDLSGKSIVAVDIETRDMGLGKGLGPGWATHDGFVTGVAVAWGDKQIYIPTRHPETKCFEVKSWLKSLFSQSNTRFVFHNAGYDLGWLTAQYGCPIPALIDDTAAMAAIVDENRLSYKLDDLCAYYGLPGKDEMLLKEAAQANGIKDIKGDMWKLPARYVGPYAEQDARATLNLYAVLRGLIDKENTQGAYQLEVDLIPMILEMRRRGIKIDVTRTEKAVKELHVKRDETLKELGDKLGHTTGIHDIRSPQWLVKAFDSENITYPRTGKGNPSFMADWMKKSEHWLPKMITRVKNLDDWANKFLQMYLLDFAHKGRIHPSIHQFRSEGGGTRSHRFSYSAPPLQQAPSRDGEFAPLFRGLFLPEKGEVWGALDYSQQEYRLIVHYAELMNLPKSHHAGDEYRNDPNTDFHNLVVQMTGLPRKKAKDTNFAKSYGAGVKQFASMTGMTESEAIKVMEQYDAMLPFVKLLGQQCQEKAERTGFIKLLDGALSHFDQWESAVWDAKGYPVDRDTAIQKTQTPGDAWYGHRIRRAYVHKACNRLVQGSAARMTKLAMRDCWNVGLVPLLQLHDELDFSFSNKKDAELAHDIMVNAVKLTVPVKVDAEFGVSWGDSMRGRTWKEVINES